MAERPLVSVVMPIRNEERSIERTLASVLAQGYPPELIEVIVADGASTDATRAIVSQVAEQTPIAVSLIDNPQMIVSTGLNAAIAGAHGEVIVRVDGHCELAPDYVARCVDALRATGADVVGGVQRAVSQRPLGRAIARATSSRFGIGNARFRYATDAGWADTVYLGAFRADVFPRFGGFDTDLVRDQDDEFNLRLRKGGGRIWLDPAIRSVYEPRASLKSLWRQYFGYGFYKVLVARKHRTIGTVRQLIPPIFVLALIASVGLGLALQSPVIAASVVVVYAAAMITASLVAGHGEMLTTILLPAVFATLHVSYGTGFLLGSWHWRRS